MQAVQYDTKLIEAPGYAYLLIPGELLDYPTESVWVRLNISSIPVSLRTNPMLDGSHRIEFNREMMRNLGIKPAQKLTMLVERLEVPPELNDMPADLLFALQGPALEEDFKRLPPETQRKYFEQVESASRETREAAIRKIVAEIEAVKDDLPRGESL